MRTPRAYRVLERIFRIARNHLGMRICEFSVMSNHIHMLIDANSQEDVSRAMQGLGIRVAKGLNRHWHRAGRIFDQRYDLRWIKNVMGVRRVVRYVLQNARKHRAFLPDGEPDPYSSARWFRWAEDICRPLRSPPVAGRGELTLVTMCGLNRSIGMSLRDLPGTRMY
jgi:REP element-mobilizing transposase RayT